MNQKQFDSLKLGIVIGIRLAAVLAGAVWAWHGATIINPGLPHLLGGLAVLYLVFDHAMTS